jgi:hypothetical protein
VKLRIFYNYFVFILGRITAAMKKTGLALLLTIVPLQALRADETIPTPGMVYIERACKRAGYISPERFKWCKAVTLRRILDENEAADRAAQAERDRSGSTTCIGGVCSTPGVPQ